MSTAEPSEKVFDAFLTALRRLDYSGYAEQYPPFGSWEDLRGGGSELMAAWRKSLRLGAETGLFVNFPFCRSRCAFCFLPVTCIGSSPAARDRFFGDYMKALGKEARAYAPLFKKTAMSTVYIGGGTPSLMTPAQVREFFALLRGHFAIPSAAQIVLEMHPDDTDPARLAAWRDCGVVRVCIGVQSLDRRVLGANARRQGPGRAAAAHAALVKAGIPGVNVDLICGLHGQGRASFLADLRKVLAFRPDQVHLNTFINTPYTLHAMRGGISGDEAEVEAARAEGFRLLEKAGYLRIDSDSMGLTPASRNLQTSGMEGRRSVLGLGPGAVSRAWGAARYINLTGWNAYAGTLARGRLPAEKWTRLGPRDEMIYYVITSLADRRRLDLAGFRKTHGADFRKVFAKEAELLKRAGAALDRSSLSVDGNMWTLVRRVFYRPEVIRRGLSNVRRAVSPRAAAGKSRNS